MTGVNHREAGQAMTNDRRDDMYEAGQFFLVTEEIEGAHPRHLDYPLLTDDLVQLTRDGTYTKIAPGLAIMGFVLRPDQQVALRPIQLAEEAF